MAILVSGGNNINVFLSDDCIVVKGIQSLTKYPKQYEQKHTKNFQSYFDRFLAFSREMFWLYHAYNFAVYQLAKLY